MFGKHWCVDSFARFSPVRIPGRVADDDEARGTGVTREHPRLVLADRSVSPNLAVDRGSRGDKQIHAQPDT